MSHTPSSKAVIFTFSGSPPGGQRRVHLCDKVLRDAHQRPHQAGEIVCAQQPILVCVVPLCTDTRKQY